MTKEYRELSYKMNGIAMGFGWYPEEDRE